MSTGPATRLAPRSLGLALFLVLPLLAVLSVRIGDTGSHSLATVVRATLATLGWADPLGQPTQTIIELRLWSTLTSAGVGAALALSGTLIQGLFRNGLAAPSVLGVTGGASLGATLAILLLGGYGPALVAVGDTGATTVLVPVFGFLGALGTVLLVSVLAAPRGRLSVPTLLLTGIAVNSCIAGVLSLISSLVLDDWEVSKAIMAWTFGTLEDRSPFHAGTVWLGLGLAALVVPFVSWELDLLAGGEEDASALGVPVRRVRLLSVGAAALAAASAVAVAGQIAFVGLVVPHLLRQLSGAAHRALLPLSLLGGATFMLAIQLVNQALLGESALRPGVVMSLVGGPFFLALLAWNRREVDAW